MVGVGVEPCGLSCVTVRVNQLEVSALLYFLLSFVCNFLSRDVEGTEVDSVLRTRGKCLYDVLKERARRYYYLIVRHNVSPAAY